MALVRRPASAAVIGASLALLVCLTACASRTGKPLSQTAASADRSTGARLAPTSAAAHQTTQRPVPTTATAKPCVPEALTILPGPILSPVTGEHGDIYLVRNIGMITCTLGGYPEIGLTVGTATLEFRYADGAGQYVTHRPPGTVALRAGADAYFLIAKYRCDVYVAATATSVLVRLPGQGATFRLPVQSTNASGHGAAILDYCTGNGEPDPGDIVAISPIASSLQRAVAN